VSDLNALNSAVDSMKVDHSPQAAAERTRAQQAAMRVLEQTGNTDLAEVLGLVAPAAKRKPAMVTADKARRPVACCPECGTEYSPHTDTQKTCSNVCRAKRGARLRAERESASGGQA